MKILAYFLVCLLIFSNTTDAEASGVKEIYTSVEEEITNYYQDGGEWVLTKIDKMEFVNSESSEYILVLAKTRICHLRTGTKTEENCLLSFIQSNREFHSINCF